MEERDGERDIYRPTDRNRCVKEWGEQGTRVGSMRLDSTG